MRSNIGDYYGLFQPEAMVVALRDLAMPLADIATPNRYELGWLTGMPIGDNAALIAAARKLGPREVLVTSAHARGWRNRNTAGHGPTGHISQSTAV